MPYNKAIQKVINFDDAIKEEKKHNSIREEIPNHPYGILITVGSASGKQIHYLIW